MKATSLPKDIATIKSTNWALPDQTVSIDDFKAEKKSRMYRNIIFGSYLVIYRITPTHIVVL